MRGITCTLVALLAVGYIASRVPWLTQPDGGAAAVSAADGWRRTAQGWEQVSRWVTPASPPSTTARGGLRPWTIAALQLLVAILALRLAQPAERRVARVKPPHADATTPDKRLEVCA